MTIAFQGSTMAMGAGDSYPGLIRVKSIRLRANAAPTPGQSTYITQSVASASGFALIDVELSAVDNQTAMYTFGTGGQDFDGLYCISRQTGVDIFIDVA